MEHSFNVLGKTTTFYILRTEGHEENVLNVSQASLFALTGFSLIPPAAYL